MDPARRTTDPGWHECPCGRAEVHESKGAGATCWICSGERHEAALLERTRKCACGRGYYLVPDHSECGSCRMLRNSRAAAARLEAEREWQEIAKREAWRALPWRIRLLKRTTGGVLALIFLAVVLAVVAVIGAVLFFWVGHSSSCSDTPDGTDYSQCYP